MVESLRRPDPEGAVPPMGEGTNSVMAQAVGDVRIVPILRYVACCRIEPIKPSFITSWNQPKPAIPICRDGSYRSGSRLVLAAMVENIPGEAFGAAVELVQAR